MARTKPPLVRPRTEGHAATEASQPGSTDGGAGPSRQTISPTGVAFFRPQLASTAGGHTGPPTYMPSNLGHQGMGSQPPGAAGNGGQQYRSSLGMLPGGNGSAIGREHEAVGRFAWQVSDEEASSTGSESTASLDEPDDGQVLDDSDPAWGSRKRSRDGRARRTARPRSRHPSPQQIAALPGERRATRMWRQQLGDLLKGVLSNVKRKLGTSKYMPFQNQVDHETVPDYSEWVKAGDEMWLQRIAQKTRMLEYTEAAQFRADVEAIRANCLAYNQPGNGRFGGPTLIVWAEELLEACQAELRANSAAIATAEAAIKDPECNPPAREVTERAAAVRHTSVVPLPKGFKHTLRVTDAKPGGWVQYEAECPVHGNLLKADRVAKLVDIFKAHSQCREEWNEFAMRPEEAFGPYNDRLREVFTFAKAVPPDTPSSRVVTTTPAGSAPAPARPLIATLPAAAWRPAPSLSHLAPASAASSLPVQAPLSKQSPGADPPQEAHEADAPTRFSVRQQAADANAGLVQHSAKEAPQSPDVHMAEAEPHDPEANGNMLLASAFKRVQEPLKPLFPPPSEPLIWPPRTNPPPNPAAPSRSTSKEAEPAPASAGSSGEDGDSQELDEASDSGYLEKRMRLSGDDRRANGAAGGSLLPPDVVSLARQRILQEAQRYTEERAVAGLQRASSSGAHRDRRAIRQDAGVADQSWGRGDVDNYVDMQAGPSAPRIVSDRHTNGRAFHPIPPASGNPPLALHFAPKVQSRQEAVEEPVPSWDGQGIFPRPCELSFLENRLKSRVSGSLLLLTGPSISGKSTILHEVRQRRQQAAGDGTDPFFVVDCRTTDMSGSVTFCSALVAAFASVLIDCDDLPDVPVPGSHDGAPASLYFTECSSMLAPVLSALSAWLALVAKQSRPVLVLDAAHRIKEGGSIWIPQLLSLFERVSRQGVHVVLATSDCRFRDWLAQRMQGFTVESMGDLSHAQARVFFQGLLQQVQESDRPAFQMEQQWDTVHGVCGGNVGLLKRALEGLVSYGNLDAALKAIWSEAGRVVRQGLERKQRPPLGAHSCAHTSEHYKAAVAAIVASPFGAVPATDLEESLQPNGVEVLDSLAASGLVALREPSALARDIPEAAYGPLQDRVVTLPSPAHGYFWSLLSKESAHAYLAITNGNSATNLIA